VWRVVLVGSVSLVAGCRAPNPSFHGTRAANDRPPAAALDARAGATVDIRLASSSPASPDGRSPDLRPPPDGGGVPSNVDLTTGLFGYWPFDEAPGATTAADLSGNENHGTLENVEAAAAWSAGRVGGALELPGGNPGGGVRVPSTRLPALTALTVAAWVNRTSNGSGNWLTVVSQEDGNTFYETFGLTFYMGEITLLLATAQTTMATFPILPCCAFGEWHHLAASWDGAAVRLYVDGKLAKTAPFAGRVRASASPVYLGNNKNGPTGGTDEPFIGRLDEVVIYTRALPATAIAALAAGATPRR
jgi:hypothetical protein